MHVTANETIDGLEFHVDPTLPPDAPPLVGDFTSTLLSRPVDFSKYGVVYASTGKNLGPSGLVVVIARKDLLTGEREMDITPGVMSWSAAAKSAPIQNIWNTPNVFGIARYSSSSRTARRRAASRLCARGRPAGRGASTTSSTPARVSTSTRWSPSSARR